MRKVGANHRLCLSVLGSAKSCITRPFVLNLKSFRPDLKSVHGGNCGFCAPGVIVGNKTEAFALRSLLVDENFGRDYVPKRREERRLVRRVREEWSGEKTGVRKLKGGRGGRKRVLTYQVGVGQISGKVVDEQVGASRTFRRLEVGVRHGSPGHGITTPKERIVGSAVHVSLRRVILRMPHGRGAGPML